MASLSAENENARNPTGGTPHGDTRLTDSAARPTANFRVTVHLHRTGLRQGNQNAAASARRRYPLPECISARESIDGRLAPPFSRFCVLQFRCTAKNGRTEPAMCVSLRNCSNHRTSPDRSDPQQTGFPSFCWRPPCAAVCGDLRFRLELSGTSKVENIRRCAVNHHL